MVLFVILGILVFTYILLNKYISKNTIKLFPIGGFLRIWDMLLSLTLPINGKNFSSVQFFLGSSILVSLI